MESQQCHKKEQFCIKNKEINDEYENFINANKNKVRKRNKKYKIKKFNAFLYCF